MNWTGENGSITIVGEDIKPVVNYKYTYSYGVQGYDMYYMSHEPRAFDKDDLTGALVRYGYDKDGNLLTTENVPLSAVSIKLTREGTDLDNPQAVYEAEGLAYCMVPLQATITDTLPVYNEETGKVEFKEVSITITSEDDFIANAWIGVKGDTNLNGECRADDASEVLTYAALNGLSEGSAKLYRAGADAARTAEWSEAYENFVYFLSDIDGESLNGGKTDAWGTGETTVNSADASYQLVYASKAGLNGTCDWATEVLNNLEKLPAITYAIVNDVK